MTSIPTSTTIGGGRKRQRRQDWIDTAFRETTKLLEELPSDGARFLAPMPSVVSLRNAVKDPPSLPFSFAPRRPRRSNSNISTNTTANSGSGSSIPNEGGVEEEGDHNVAGDPDDDGATADGATRRDQHLRGGVYLQQPNVSAIQQHRRGQQHNNDGSLLTPNRGHYALFRGLEDLEDFDKLESELQWFL